MTNQYCLLGESFATNVTLNDNETAALLRELGDTLDTFALWESAAGNFAKGYSKVEGCKLESGLVQFGRLMKLAGFTKPKATSVQAAKKAAQRAATKAAKGEAVGSDADIMLAPSTGLLAASKVKQELTAMEAHILSMYRSGNFIKLVECIRAEAEKAALV